MAAVVGLLTQSSNIGTPPTAVESPAPSPGPSPKPSPVASPLPTPSPTQAAPPVRLVVDAVAIDVSVVEVGVDDAGQMEVPPDVGTVGWYRFGPSPGAPGSAVLAGHVDSRTQGRGAFFRLVELGLGDRATVTDVEGTDREFEVVARRAIDKSELPTEELFARSGAAHLVLVTCGGAFDAETRHYRENVVVWLRPAS